jgi:hypothetical protein
VNQCLALHVEQLAGEGVQDPQPELAVLLKLFPTEKAQTDMSRFTSVPWHVGHATFSDTLVTKVSKFF